MRVLVKSLKRYGISGIAFTIIGPVVFWFLYALGSVWSVVLTECIVHAVRFAVFKRFVFREKDGYKVDILGYIAAAAPVTAIFYM